MLVLMIFAYKPSLSIGLLLSFIPLSHIVVPKRILMNTSFSFHLSILDNFQEFLNNIAMNIEIDTPRSWFTNSSSNSSRVLWQLLDQCPIAVQVVNLTGGISSGNMSCVFIRELDREPQQYPTDYLYKYPWSVLQLCIVLS